MEAVLCRRLTAWLFHLDIGYSPAWRDPADAGRTLDIPRFPTFRVPLGYWIFLVGHWIFRHSLLSAFPWILDILPPGGIPRMRDGHWIFPDSQLSAFPWTLDISRGCGTDIGYSIFSLTAISRTATAGRYIYGTNQTIWGSYSRIVRKIKK